MQVYSSMKNREKKLINVIKSRFHGVKMKHDKRGEIILPYIGGTKTAVEFVIYEDMVKVWRPGNNTIVCSNNYNSDEQYIQAVKKAIYESIKILQLKKQKAEREEKVNNILLIELQGLLDEMKIDHVKISSTESYVRLNSGTRAYSQKGSDGKTFYVAEMKLAFNKERFKEFLKFIKGGNNEV